MPSGEVDGVAWRLDHDGDRQPPDQLLIGEGESQTVVPLEHDGAGCFVTDRMHGSWCSVAELARAMIQHDPDLAPAAQP